MRIVVVEDQPLFRRGLIDLLDAEGFRVDGAAGTVREAVDVVAARMPDLVLMDLQLPGMDGAETLHRLREGTLDRRVPVVAVTALAMPGDRAHAADEGFDGYIEKPISVRALPVQVRSFLDGGTP